MSYDNFVLPAGCTIKYPTETWRDPAVITEFEDQISVEVVNVGAGGFWKNWNVTIQAHETAARPAQTELFAFLRAHRLRGIPFYFNHRKWGVKLVRYWSDELPMPRTVAGSAGDIIEFDLPLRAIEVGV